MQYTYITSNSQIVDHIEQAWQLRIHVAREAIEGVDNKIQEIKDILGPLFNETNSDIKIFHLDDNKDLGSYDGCQSTRGLDRTLVGKEVCLYLPDAHIQQMNSEQYKSTLLMLWKSLQERNIPLLCMNLSGDQSIFIGNESILPSPFSFTCNHPIVDDWKGRNGILFKEFTAYGQHPILNVSFTIEDIIKSNIALHDTLQRSSNYLNSHETLVTGMIEENLKQLEQKEDTFTQFLDDDQRTVQNFEAMIRSLKSCQGIAKNELYEAVVTNNTDFDTVISHYPHQADSLWSFHPLLDEINTRTLESTSGNPTDWFIRLRNDLPCLIESLKSDFKAANIHHLFGHNVEKLIDINPAMMQVIFRQYILLSHEKALNQVLSTDLKAVKSLLLTQYKERLINRSNDFHHQLSFLAKAIHKAHSKTDKIRAIDAVIDHLNQGNDTQALSPHKHALEEGQLGALMNSIGLKLRADNTKSYQRRL